MVRFTLHACMLTLAISLGLVSSTSFSNGTFNSTLSTASDRASTSSERRYHESSTSQSSRSITSNLSVDGEIGAFIASGLGMTRTTDPSVIGVTEDSTSTATLSHSTNTTTQDLSTTLQPSLANVASNTSDAYSRYRNMTFTGECWVQWNSFWTASTFLASQDPYTWVDLDTTTTLQYTDYTVYDWSASTETKSTTMTVSNGAFAQATLTTVTKIFIPASSPWSTYETTQTVYDVSKKAFDVPSVTPPACLLPTSLPACQSSWESWISRDKKLPEEPVGCSSNLYASTQAPSCSAAVSAWSVSHEKAWSIFDEPRPLCTQAVITGPYCSSRVSGYLESQGIFGKQSDGVVGGERIETTSMRGNETIATYYYTWPATSTLVPGCTIGCQSCRINGGTVQLIYWPPASSTWIDGTYSALSGNSSGTSTVVTLGTTLTSPTVYVSFDSLYARDSCSVFTKTHFNSIVAITNTANLSSIYGYGYINNLGAKASFNFTDLYVSPVPDSIYERQPRCASSLLYTRHKDGPRPSGWTCPRIAPYEPILALPAEVRHLDPDWANCVGGVNGVYDPPLALTPAKSIAQATTFAASSLEVSSEAVPASSPVPTLAPLTSATWGQDPVFTTQPEDGLLASEGTSGASRPQSSDGSEHHPGEHDQPAQGAKQSDILPPSSGQGEDDSVNETGGGAMSVPAGSKGNIQSPSPTQDPQDPQSPRPDPAEAKAQTTDDPNINDGASPANALSVFLEAQSFLDATQSGQSDNDPDLLSHTLVADGGNGEDPKVSSHNTGSVDASHIMATIPVGATRSATLYTADGSIVIAQDGSTVAALPGSGEITIGTHIYSIVSKGDAVVVDGSATHAMPSAASRSVSNEVGDLAATSEAVWSAGGSTFTAAMHGDTIIVHGPDSTHTLAAGADMMLAGELVSVQAGRGALLHGGKMVSFVATDADDLQAVTTTLQDGQRLVASAAHGSVIVRGVGGDLTLVAGEHTVFGSETLSLAESATALIVNGSITLPLAAGTMHTTSPGESVGSEQTAAETRSAARTRDGTDTASLVMTAATEAASNAAIAIAPVSMRMLLLVTCIVGWTSFQ